MKAPYWWLGSALPFYEDEDGCDDVEGAHNPTDERPDPNGPDQAEDEDVDSRALGVSVHHGDKTHQYQKAENHGYNASRYPYDAPSVKAPIPDEVINHVKGFDADLDETEDDTHNGSHFRQYLTRFQIRHNTHLHRGGRYGGPPLPRLKRLSSPPFGGLRIKKGENSTRGVKSLQTGKYDALHMDAPLLSSFFPSADVMDPPQLRRLLHQLLVGCPEGVIKNLGAGHIACIIYCQSILIGQPYCLRANNLIQPIGINLK